MCIRVLMRNEKKKASKHVHACTCSCCFDPSAHNVWLKLHTSGDGPSSRDGHACTLLGNEMVIHGGFASRVREGVREGDREGDDVVCFLVS